MFHFNIDLRQISDSFNLNLLYYKYPPVFKKYFSQRDCPTNIWKIWENYRHQDDGKMAFMEIVKKNSTHNGAAIKRRLKILQELAGKENRVLMKTQSRFLCGVGYQSPLEWGLQFDWTTGVPFLPGSSFKGALLSYLEFCHRGAKPIEEWKEKDEAKLEKEAWSRDEIFHVFGPQGNSQKPIKNPKVGDVVFLDVYPIEFTGLDIDVITPHYKDYYTKGDVPADIYNPMPVHFLTLPPNTKFLFLYKFRRDDDKNLTKKLKNLIQETGENFGFGAKTSSGYGYFNKSEKNEHL